MKTRTLIFLVGTLVLAAALPALAQEGAENPAQAEFKASTGNPQPAAPKAMDEAKTGSIAEEIRSRVPDSMRKDFLFLEVWQWLGLLLVVMLGIILDRIVIKILQTITHRSLEKGDVKIEVDRKVLADIAVNDAASFSALVEKAKAAIPSR